MSNERHTLEIYYNGMKEHDAAYIVGHVNEMGWHVENAKRDICVRFGVCPDTEYGQKMIRLMSHIVDGKTSCPIQIFYA
jgi:ribosomal protein S15P/S13E